MSLKAPLNGFMCGFEMQKRKRKPQHINMGEKQKSAGSYKTCKLY